METENYVIGIDFGTDSVRTIIVNAKDGSEIAVSVHPYPMWGEGRFCDPAKNRFRQHPSEYIEGMEITIREALEKGGPAIRKNIRAISAATTGSTPVAVDRTGTPLALQPGFTDDPDAMFILWKDHTAMAEAAEINAQATKQEINYLKYVGGVYSSEWYWSKLLHILRRGGKVREHCYSFVEHCDWIPFLLTGGTDLNGLKRGICSAGHKGLWAKEWGGFPPECFFSAVDPLLPGFAATLPKKVYTADQPAGKLSVEWSEKFGLQPGVLVGIGAMDAHMGAVGGQIEPYYLGKVMGTSTCDMLVAPAADMEGKFVRGICGQVDGSIIPGMTGMEAGQSAFGDVYAWFGDLLSWPLKHILSDPTRILSDKIIPELSRQAELVGFDENSELAVDWFNGRRSPGARNDLKAAMTGLNLASEAPGIFRALAESTCFGSKAIIECFIQQGIPVKGLIGTGGIAKKSPFIMQMLSDTTGMSIAINHSDQTCALGAAMFAATAAGIYPKVEDAMAAMGHGFGRTYYPNKSLQPLYRSRYLRYQEFGKYIEDHS